MKSIAFNLLGNAADAEDAVQEAFLKIYRGAKTFRGGAAFSTWAFRVMVNTCYDALRRRRTAPRSRLRTGAKCCRRRPRRTIRCASRSKSPSPA
jgi:RNA polymerase sigma factor (sigma-70 family)